MGKTARKKLKEARAAGTVQTHRVHDTGQVVSGMLSVSSHSASALATLKNYIYMVPFLLQPQNQFSTSRQPQEVIKTSIRRQETALGRGLHGKALPAALTQLPC